MRILNSYEEDTIVPHLTHEPSASSRGAISFIYAVAAGETPDEPALYRCPTCSPEELRLTWDSLRNRHAGFCTQCRKLWPLPRRTVTKNKLREALRAVPREELVEILKQERLL